MSFCVGCFTRDHHGPRRVCERATQSPADSKTHVLFCTALGVGHYTPVANAIAALFRKPRPLRVTFFSPIRAWEVPSCRPPAVSTEFVRCHQVPLAGDDVHPITMNAMLTRRDQLTAELDKVLSSDPSWPPVSVVVHDFFAIYAFEYAEYKLKVPRVIFNPSHSLCFKWMGDKDLNTRILRGEKFLTVKGFKEPCDVQIIWHMLTLGPVEPVFKTYEVTKIAKTALGMITTDIPSLFPTQLEEIRHVIAHDRQKNNFFGLFPLYYIGPTCVHDKNAVTRAAGSGSGGGSSTSTWLDRQSEKSVLFIALGTLYPIPLDALGALMGALERLGRPFLWAYKSRGESREEARQMLEAFSARTAGYGLVEDWVDQTAVLNHPALRVFVTHGGWNSFVECATFAGVPMVCVPLGSEQPINALLVQYGLGIGRMALTEDENWTNPEPFTESDVEAAVARLPDGFSGMVETMLPFQRVKYRFLTGLEWDAVLSDVCERSFERYWANAKEVQATILKSTLVDTELDEIAYYLNSLRGVDKNTHFVS